MSKNAKALVTHVVMRAFSADRPLRIGETVDASIGWLNLALLERSGFVRALPVALDVLELHRRERAGELLKKLEDEEREMRSKAAALEQKVKLADERLAALAAEQAALVEQRKQAETERLSLQNWIAETLPAELRLRARIREARERRLHPI